MGRDAGPREMTAVLNLHHAQAHRAQQFMLGRFHENEESRKMYDSCGIGIAEFYPAGGLKFGHNFNTLNHEWDESARMKDGGG